MDRYCPECNSTMTPSLVGYLCVNCGHAQRFYSAQEAALAKPITPVLAVRGMGNSIKKAENQQKSYKKSTKPSKNKVKSTLKRLMVPELAPPHPHLIGDGDDSIKPVLADKIEDEQSMPAMIASTSEVNRAESVNQNDKFKQPDSQAPSAIELITDNKVVPNQSSNLSELESALHPQRNTSIWVMLGLAVLMLIVAAAVLFLIILS